MTREAALLAAAIWDSKALMRFNLFSSFFFFSSSKITFFTASQSANEVTSSNLWRSLRHLRTCPSHARLEHLSRMFGGMG